MSSEGLRTGYFYCSSTERSCCLHCLQTLQSQLWNRWALWMVVSWADAGQQQARGFQLSWLAVTAEGANVTPHNLSPFHYNPHPLSLVHHRSGFSSPQAIFGTRISICLICIRFSILWVSNTHLTLSHRQLATGLLPGAASRRRTKPRARGWQRASSTRPVFLHLMVHWAPCPGRRLSLGTWKLNL